MARMPRPVLFFDLAGTLEVRDPRTGRRGAWPGADALLAGLARRFDLHLTTGEDPGLAAPSLADLGLAAPFTGIHAGLSGGGKPFGVLAAELGVPADRCLAVGDSLVSDTAGDSDRVVSVILAGDGAMDPARLGRVIDELWAEGSFLAGFRAAVAATAGGRPGPADPPPADLDALRPSPLGGGCRLGWWRKSAASRRPVVLLRA
jgi:hypothetical protein